MAKKEFGNKVEQILGNYSGGISGSSETELKDKKHSTVGGIKRAYYFTPEQIKAIALKAATDDMTKNEVVQEALNLYLKEYLK